MTVAGAGINAFAVYDIYWGCGELGRSSMNAGSGIAVGITMAIMGIMLWALALRVLIH
ncbi:hypothetical protein BVRB_036150 [Beta vulgaris subsp. vulgaris]|uniref:Uncharacterized protein n=1 Tax=Beta vulgaris subsp. vulgaris TaxID=3555 RepID=A0A0J7YPF4_BETVV|nr:hypothetical protein BVRB_036150 [Beta vulgaris subsp. vulgaris]